MRIDILQIPMYGLYYVGKSQNDFILDDKFLAKLKADYDQQEINKIFRGLEWAIKNPDYDFNSLLPNLTIKNSEIFKYLSRWHNCLNQNKEFLGIQ